MQHTATYSPDDDKLRIYPAARLAEAEYLAVKAAGYRWAPKQECFFAVWTPHAEDKARDLAGEIDDEDKSLAERAEERAERFDGYSENRAKDAAQAREAVARIADGIPLGQPILIGHHSERHARRDAERIENGMRKAVKAWETSEYWTRRAAAAIAHASYKERPDVRARRIKTIEADLRKMQRNVKAGEDAAKLWALVDKPEAWKPLPDGRAMTREERACYIAGRQSYNIIATTDDGLRWTAYDVLQPDEAGRNRLAPRMSVDDVLATLQRQRDSYAAHARRWIEHYEHRLAYERAMLGKTDYIQPPKAPTRAALPLLNYEGDRMGAGVYGNPPKLYTCITMTSAEWADIGSDYKGTRISEDGTHRFRTAYCRRTAHTLAAVYISDAKTHPKPGGEIKTAEDAEVAARVEKGVARLNAERQRAREIREHNRRVIRGEPKPETQAPTAAPAAQGEIFAAMRDTLAAGVQVVTAPQLFPTPPELAARMVELAEIQPGERVLEPSAGTGAILGAINGRAKECQVVAVEINPTLGGRLDATHCAVVVGDFLACEASTLWGEFDRVLMNPPFANAADVKHIQHARAMLKEGGRLVAICANGPRQREALMPLATLWEDLPPGTFKEAGTNVSTALVVIDN